MGTAKLYYEDPHCLDFTARVFSCTMEKDGYAVILDRTAFYPEGGGQPADHGFLGEAAVTHVREKDGAVVHLTDRPLPEGETVAGRVDRKRRLDHMQQHSGEHIVSGLICRRYGCDNVGFHISEDFVTIDFNASLRREDLWPIEDAANALIRADVPVRIVWPSPDELEKLEYRSKKALTGEVRIVEFPGADICACCGTHVVRTGEIGLVKLLSAEPHRGGTRIEMVCGRRALEYLRLIHEESHAAAVQLSVKPTALAAAVARLKEENLRLKERAAALESRENERRAKELAGAGNVLLVEEGLSPDAARRLADTVGEAAGGFCGVLAREESGGPLRYVLLAPAGGLRALVKELNAAFGGRGGGSESFAQGSLAAETRPDDAAAFLSGRIPSLRVI